MAAVIQLSNGQTIVDDDVAVWLPSARPRILRSYHPYVVVKNEDGTRPKRIGLSRRIMAAPAGKVVDHINGDTLDNRRANLRVCSQGQNAKNNRKMGTRAVCKYKGVCLFQGRFQSTLMVDGKRIWLGSHADEISAALAYDEGARFHHGQFACVNFPKPGERPALAETLASHGGGNNHG